MENQIQNYGVYIKGASSYVQATPYPYNYIDYKHFDKIPFVERENDNFEAVIFQKDLNPQILSFGIRSFEITTSNKAFPVQLSPMDKEDMYKVTAAEPLPKDTILFINGVWDGEGRSHIISLGEPQEQLVKLFSDMEQTPAYAVLASLEDSCTVYPENQTLKNLLPAWRKLAEQESDASDFKYVAEAWARYKESDKVDLQIRYLYETYREINGYVEKHPQGKHAKEMIERQEWMDGKIEELEKLV